MHCRILLVALILLVGARSASGKDYTDPSGFSFTHSDAWVAFNRASLGDMRQAFPRELKNWISRNRIDFNQVAMVLVRNGRGDFLENLNVVVDQKQQIPVDDATVAQLKAMLPKQYLTMGIKVDDLKVSVGRFGTREAIVADYRAKLPGVPYTLRQKQAIFPGGGKTYTVTCTAKADAFPRYQPTFDKVLASFNVPPPAAVQSVNWGQSMNMGWVGGIIGGLAGGIAWLVRKISA
jgi:hypothetical protein